ncbi:hypothetical protein GGX14DRAFT_580242 [Mycena pura]|uniref:Uncharacterized protein n=1 Tax=Mycena pura TaxID=153505 RepID=A0AAD6ULT8_9AGAR|nr:hypothetical protein GGX14DRAFT_580242 [Mycena pura]
MVFFSRQARHLGDDRKQAQRSLTASAVSLFSTTCAAALHHPAHALLSVHRLICDACRRHCPESPCARCAGSVSTPDARRWYRLSMPCDALHRCRRLVMPHDSALHRTPSPLPRAHSWERARVSLSTPDTTATAFQASTATAFHRLACRCPAPRGLFSTPTTALHCPAHAYGSVRGLIFDARRRRRLVKPHGPRRCPARHADALRHTAVCGLVCDASHHRRLAMLHGTALRRDPCTHFRRRPLSRPCDAPRRRPACTQFRRRLVKPRDAALHTLP